LEPDKQAFVSAMERQHGLRLRRYLSSRLRDRLSDVPDLVQEVFLRLLRRDPAVAAEIDNPESYLRRSAVNAALDVVRARHDSDTLEPERMAASGSCTELRELRDSLRKALSKLPVRTAEMFALRCFEGYTNPEIAKLMGLSQIVVAVTLHRTRKKLQKEMGATR